MDNTLEYEQRDMVTGKRDKTNPLNKVNLTRYELDEIMMGDQYE